MPVSSSPQSFPASTPFLAASYVSTPTSSSDGWRMTSRRARRPTLPVAHWITRSAAVPSPGSDAMGADDNSGRSPRPRSPFRSSDARPHSLWGSVTCSRRGGGAEGAEEEVDVGGGDLVDGHRAVGAEPERDARA